MNRTRLAAVLRVVFWLLVVGFCACSGGPVAPPTAPLPTAQPSAPPVGSKRGTTVELTGTAGNTSGYLALPAGEGKRPAVLVIQEWWGLDAWIREGTDRLASKGYVALA